MPSTGQVLCTDCGPEQCRRKTAGNNFAALLGDDASSSSSDDEVAVAAPPALKLLPLPRVKASELTYLTFLREFALPGKPFILEGVGDDWPARARWADPSYFLEHAGVDLERECTISVGAFGGGALAEEETTVGDALRRLVARRADTTSDGAPVYLNAWPYVRGGSGALQADFEVPSVFARSAAWAEESPVLGNAAVDLKWVYVGESNTGSGSHVDCNMTSAWLWCAAGEKEWRCVHAQDSDALLATNALSGRAALGGGGGGDGSDDEEEEAPVPDLFRPDLQRFPRLAAARVYAGVQRAGDVCFNPSGCLHAVRNNAFTVSLTHNYVDASNLGAVLADGARSLTSELLPMARALGPKKFLKTLRKSLGGGLKASELEALLRALPTLASDAAVAEAIDAAVRPESGVDSAEARELLAGGARGEALGAAREAFGGAAKTLCEALGL